MVPVKAVTHRDGTVVYRVRYRAGGRNPVGNHDAASAQRRRPRRPYRRAAARELRSSPPRRLSTTSRPWPHLPRLARSAGRQIARPYRPPRPYPRYHSSHLSRSGSQTCAAPPSPGATAGRPRRQRLICTRRRPYPLPCNAFDGSTAMSRRPSPLPKDATNVRPHQTSSPASRTDPRRLPKPSSPLMYGLACDR